MGRGKIYPALPPSVKRYCVHASPRCEYPRRPITFPPLHAEAPSSLSITPFPPFTPQRPNASPLTPHPPSLPPPKCTSIPNPPHQHNNATPPPPPPSPPPLPHIYLPRHPHPAALRMGLDRLPPPRTRAPLPHRHAAPDPVCVRVRVLCIRRDGKRRGEGCVGGLGELRERGGGEEGGECSTAFCEERRGCTQCCVAGGRSVDDVVAAYTAAGGVRPHGCYYARGGLRAGHRHEAGSDAAGSEAGFVVG